MNKKMKILIISIGIVIVGLMYYRYVQKKTDIRIENNTMSLLPTVIETKPTKRGEMTFQDTITDVTYGCHVDGTCAVKVGSYWVTVLQGESLKEQVKGKSIGLSLDQSKKGMVVGKLAKVKAVFTGSDTMTIYGSEDYYLEVTSIQNKKSDSTVQSCTSDSDCVLFMCSGGCMNKQEAKNNPPDLACITYQDYTCTCEHNQCVRNKK